MGYRLERGESVQAGMVRVVVEELDGAVDRLTSAEGDRVRAVHEARKHVKKARSALRLVRDELPRKTYDRENDRLRQAARRLSGVRDAQVAVSTLDRLREAGGDVAPEVWDAVRSVLVDRQQAAGEALLGTGGFVTEVAEDLAEARDGAAGLTLRRGGWKALSGGLAREYGRGLDARSTAGRKPKVENLHAWRRRVKDSWYHVRLLESAWPALLGDLSEEAHRLSELLGDDHDLANLRSTLTDDADVFGVQLDDLLAQLDDRRRQLQAEARLLGDRLYAETPRAYVNRLGAYWRAWRRSDEAPPAATDAPPAAPPVVVAEPRLTVTPGTVERPAATAPTPPRPAAPLLAKPALGTVERPAFVSAPATLTVPEPLLPRPTLTPTDGTPTPPPVDPATEHSEPAPPAEQPDPEPEPTAESDAQATDAPAATAADDETPAEAATDAVTGKVAPSAGKPAAERPTTAQGVGTVYAVKGGRRYHRPNCALAGANARPLPLTEAQAGGLTPCGSCRP